MNLRIDSMPRQNTTAWAIHISTKAIQPSSDSPVKPYCCTSAYGPRPGQSLSATMTSECDAR